MSNAKRKSVDMRESVFISVFFVDSPTNTSALGKRQ